VLAIWRFATGTGGATYGYSFHTQSRPNVSISNIHQPKELPWCHGRSDSRHGASIIIARRVCQVRRAFEGREDGFQIIVSYDLDVDGPGQDLHSAKWIIVELVGVGLAS
jgi:hypothetical protein